MRWVFDAIFEAAGSALGDHVTLAPARTLARHAWTADAHLDLFADVAESESAIGDFAGAAEARGYRGFCEEARRIYRTLETTFMTASRPTPLSLAARIGLRRLPDLFAIDPYRTMWSALGRHFTDPRLRQLFGRYATYCGSSPFRAPATLMLIADVEQSGVWLVEGGMQRMADGLAALAAARGARLRFGEHCAGLIVECGRVAGVTLATGERISASAVVFNGDPSALGDGALGTQAMTATAPVSRADRSLSAVTWLLHAETSGFPLVRHNVFFSDDYAAEFADIEQDRLPGAPTVYICAQDRDDRGALASAGAERLQLIVNAPATGDRREFGPSEIESCEMRMFGLLERCGLKTSVQASQVTTPRDFAGLFPGSGGALYGRASHGWRASFQRPGSRTRMPGLYLAGGASHPGAGVPMAALSGRLAAESVLADRRS